MSGSGEFDAPPPTYQDALVQGILMRTGKTPFPEAPRMGPRGLDDLLSANSDAKAPLLKPSRFRSNIIAMAAVMEEAATPPSSPREVQKKKHIPSGYQSDISHLRQSKTISPPVKRKSQLKPAVSPSHSEPSLPLSPGCKIQRLFAFSQIRPVLIMDLTKALSHARISGDIPSRLRDAEWDKPATSPPQVAMSIKCEPLRQWPVRVQNKSGVTYRDVLLTLREMLSTNLTQQEWDAVTGPFRERVKLAFQRRCSAVDGLTEVERRKGLRRIDLLCEAILWKGMSSRPDSAGFWILYVAAR